MSLILVLLLLVCFSEVSVCSTFTWSPRRLEVNEGDEISMACHHEELGFFEVLRLAKCYGKDEDECDEDLTISENYYLKDDFSKTNRYRVDFVGNKTTLQITNAEGSDAGRIKCNSLGSDAYSIATITVKSRAKRVRFFTLNHQEQMNYHLGTQFTNDSTADDNVATMSWSSKAVKSVGCAVETYINDEIKSKYLKIDGQIIQDVLEKEIPKGANELETLLDTEKLSMQYNGEVLECSVSVNHFEPQSTKIKLNIKTPPVIQADHQGYQLHLLNNSAQLAMDSKDNLNETEDNENETDNLSYKLIFHVFGNPAPRIYLNLNATLPSGNPIINVEETSNNLVKVTLDYMGWFDTELKQALRVENGEGVDFIVFTLGDGKPVKLGNLKWKGDLEIIEESLEMSKNNLEYNWRKDVRSGSEDITKSSVNFILCCSIIILQIIYCIVFY